MTPTWKIKNIHVENPFSPTQHRIDMSSGLNYCETVDFCNSLYIMRQPCKESPSTSAHH